MNYLAWAATDVGNVKTVNEDSYFIDRERGVFLVADGVSGRQAGELASYMVADHVEKKAEELSEFVRQGDPIEDDEHREKVLDRITRVVQDINTELYQLGKQPEYAGGMATTLVMLVVGPTAAFVAHVGDSRVYLHREEEIFRITEDHTYAEMLKQQNGVFEKLTPELRKRYSHVLTRSIGGRPHVDVDIVFFELQPHDAFLLCTDGLTDYLSGSEILDYVNHRDAEEIASSLVQEAKDRGGRDNITGAFIKLSSESQFESTTAKIDTLRKINFLEEMPLFEDMTRMELLRVLRVVYEHTFEPGELVLELNTRSKYLNLIIEGGVRLSRDDKTIAELGVGAHFGEMSLFESSVSSVHVHATSELTMLALPLTQLQTLIREEPEVGNKLLWNLMRQLSHHIERMNIMYAGGNFEPDPEETAEMDPLTLTKD